MDYLSVIPRELYEIITHHLTIQNLLRLSELSKFFYNVITSEFDEYV